MKRPPYPIKDLKPYYPGSENKPETLEEMFKDWVVYEMKDTPETRRELRRLDNYARYGLYLDFGDIMQLSERKRNKILKKIREKEDEYRLKRAQDAKALRELDGVLFKNYGSDVTLSPGTCPA